MKELQEAQSIIDAVGKADPHQTGRITTNLIIVKNGFQGTDEQWEEFLNHVKYPDDYPNLEDLFRVDVDVKSGYKELMAAVEEVYQQSE